MLPLLPRVLSQSCVSILMPITSFAVNFAATRGGAGEGVGRSTRMSCAVGVGGGGRLVGTCDKETSAAGEVRRFFWTPSSARVSALHRAAILEHTYGNVVFN